MCEVLQISHSFIDLALGDTTPSGVFIGINRNIDRLPANKTPTSQLRHVRQHINSFPRLPSHYCRKSSKKLYLDPELNVSELYRLYVKDYCVKAAIQPVSAWIFRKVFSEYNPPLATFVPKKDLCSICKQYMEAKGNVTAALKELCNAHKRREKEALEMKAADMASLTSNTLTGTFDLQAILNLPFASDSCLYYKRKLSLYNFTIYEQNSTGHCYLWDEVNGKKGSSEIGTCLLQWIRGLPIYVNHIITYSDTCGGQNRNQYIAALMIFVVSTLPHINNIVDMKYMESGHSYMEVDSMHATIERERKHRQVYLPSEMRVLIESARKMKEPYKVNVLTHSNFVDLQEFASLIMFNTKTDEKGNTVSWLKIKWIRFEKNNPFILQIKYNLSDETFTRINVLQKNNINLVPPHTLHLPQKYFSKQPISCQKKKDLLSLVQSGVIPEYAADFYLALPTSKFMKDTVAYVTEEEVVFNDDD